MPTRLEIWGIGLLILALALGGAYFKGRHDEYHTVVNEQLAANEKALTAAAAAATARAAADDTARQKATDFIASVDQGISHVNAQFASLPPVVVDARGCPQLTPAAGMRWNAIELLPAGPTPDATGSAPATVPASPVPAP